MRAHKSERRGRALTAGALALCLLAVAAPLAAKPAKPAKPAKVTHTETITYVGANGGSTPNATAWELVRCDSDLPGCNKIPTEPGDRFAMVSVKDASGTQIDTVVSQTPGDAYSYFCGSSTDPIPVAGGAPLYVWTIAGQCGDKPSIPTTGEVTATFYNAAPPAAPASK